MKLLLSFIHMHPSSCMYVCACTHIYITHVRYSSCKRSSDTTGIKEAYLGTSLSVQGLRLHFQCRGCGCCPGQGAESPHATWPRKEKERNAPPPYSHSHTSSVTPCPPTVRAPLQFLRLLSVHFEHLHAHLYFCSCKNEITLPNLIFLKNLTIFMANASF